MSPISDKTGLLCVYAYESNRAKPVPGAKVSIYGETESKPRLIHELLTNSSGQIDDIPLTAPDKRLTLEPSNVRPYAKYKMIVEADNYNPVVVDGVELFGGIKSIQEVSMTPVASIRASDQTIEQISIPEHVLYGKYPEKIPETPQTEIAPIPVGAQPWFPGVIVPEFVEVHLGHPDQPAKNIRVPYIDYIKGVACREIYSTWARASLEANIICIVSFTLNKIMNEPYRRQGKNFTITSLTRFDHAFVPGGTIFEPISKVVDEIFTTYIRIPWERGFSVPFMAQYVRGIPGSPRPTKPNWVSQWGTQYLAEKLKYKPLQILEYYYGKILRKVELSSEVREIKGIPESFKQVLKKGSTGEEVKTIQDQLNTIAKNYPALPKLTVDGKFGPKTEASVKVFQKIANLSQNGIVDRATWYEISRFFVAISRLETAKPLSGF